MGLRVDLSKVPARRVRELIAKSWRHSAPKRVVAAYDKLAGLPKAHTGSALGYLARISHEQEFIREKLAEGASVSRMDSQSWQERHTNTAVARNCLEVVKERVTRTGPV